MNNEDLRKLVAIRTDLIKLYQWLPGKSEPSSLVKTKDVALDLAHVISKVDKLLDGKVNFTAGKE
tara:strand:- start:14315 stop:14509 length:195 start_codon:yes stop_codon:yes gene_type:complete